MYHTDTITALASPVGSGALHIIRVSGDQAIEEVAKIFKPQEKLLQAKSHSLVYGKIISDNQLLDEVLCSVFRAPNSFTGENSVEITCHGSMFVANSILAALQKSIRLAKAGEFTLRAFLNNRIDLTQAEAVNDMIQAKTKKAQALAINQLDGSLYKRMSLLLDELSNYRIQLELEIDFLDDDLPDIDLDLLKENLLKLKGKLENLVTSGKQGRIIREGLKVSLIGKPNVGKSSIFNKLLETERAIVTPIPGTTRDYLEEVIALDGYLIRIYDTAGIRETSDTIEKLGIDRSRGIIQESDIILYITDGNHNQDDYQDFVAGLDPNKIIKILNKTDILDKELIANFPDYLKCHSSNEIGIKPLKDKLLSYIQMSDQELESGLLTNGRQIAAVEKAILSLKQAIASLENFMGYEFTAFDLKEASAFLEDVIGKITDDDLLNSIFDNFCIGK